MREEEEAMEEEAATQVPAATSTANSATATQDATPNTMSSPSCVDAPPAVGTLTVQALVREPVSESLVEQAEGIASPAGDKEEAGKQHRVAEDGMATQVPAATTTSDAAATAQTATSNDAAPSPCVSAPPAAGAVTVHALVPEPIPEKPLTQREGVAGPRGKDEDVRKEQGLVEDAKDPDLPRPQPGNSSSSSSQRRPQRLQRRRLRLHERSSS